MAEELELEGYKVLIVGGADIDWEVWLNTDKSDFDGLCIGSGTTRELAVEYAIATLSPALNWLQNALEE